MPGLRRLLSDSHQTNFIVHITAKPQIRAGSLQPRSVSLCFSIERSVGWVEARSYTLHRHFIAAEARLLITFSKAVVCYLPQVNGVNGGDTVFVRCVSVCVSVRSGPVNQTRLKRLKVRTADGLQF